MVNIRMRFIKMMSAFYLFSGFLNTANAKSLDNAKAGLKKASNANSGSDVNTIAGNIVSTLLFVAGLLAVIVIIYSGIKYMTANGDKQKIESAKSTLIYAIVGLVIAIVAYAIVNYVISKF